MYINRHTFSSSTNRCTIYLHFSTFYTYIFWFISMAFVEDMIFVVGLTGLVYLMTNELLLIASVSHKQKSSSKLGSSRIDFSLKNSDKDSNFSDVVQKSLVFDDILEAKVDDFDQIVCSGVEQFGVFSDTQEARFDDFDYSECSEVEESKGSDNAQVANVDDFVQRECFNGEFDNGVEVRISRKYCFDDDYVSGGDELVEDLVEQNFEFPGLDRGVKMFDELSQRDEEMEDEENVCFNVGDEVNQEGWEDDWEGVERTELEKQFGAAVAFVNFKGNADRFLGVESNVKMELYGLHKVAIEGICRKPQPMALKVYSRAKWNAWKQLENINREEAMEKYIALLSRNVPGWMEDRHK